MLRVLSTFFFTYIVVYYVLQRFLGGFATRCDKKYSFALIDEEEHALYQSIGDIINNNSHPLSEENRSKIKAQQKILSDLHIKHAKLTYQMIENHEVLWVKTLSETSKLLEVDTEKERLKKLKEELLFFLRDFCVFDESDEGKDLKLHIQSMLLKLISRPKGQRLLLRLNQLKQANSELKINIKLSDAVYVRGNSISLGYATQQANASGLKAVYKGEKEKTILFFYSNEEYRNAYDSVFFATKVGAKKDEYSFGIPFVDFAHELIHCLHFFRGSFRANLPFSSELGQFSKRYFSVPLLGNSEELWTIEKAKLSENAIREEHGLLPRRSYISVSLDNIGRLKKEESRLLSSFFNH